MVDYVFDDEVCPERRGGLKHIAGSIDGKCPYCLSKCFIAAKDAPPLTPNVAEQLAELGIVNGANGSLSPDCIVDHDSLVHGSTCGQCGVMHEGRFATGDLAGPAWGLGRFVFDNGRLSARDERKLTFVSQHPGREVPG